MQSASICNALVKFQQKDASQSWRKPDKEEKSLQTMCEFSTCSRFSKFAGSFRDF